MKKIKSAASILLCMTMLISMCVIGASAEDFVIDDGGDDVVTTDGYSMSVKLFVGSGGNVLIARLINLILSDASDLTVTLYTVGANDELTQYCGFAADEIIVEQPNEYHNAVELYLKNDMVPARDDTVFYVIRIESGSMTDTDGGVVSSIDYRYVHDDIISFDFDYDIDSEENNGVLDETSTIGNWITLDLWGFKDRTNSITVTADTPNTLSVRDKTTIDIIGAGDAQFSVKYNDFVYETWTIKTYTKFGDYINYLKETIDEHSVSSIGEYFQNIGNAFATIVEIPTFIVGGMVVMWPIAPIVPIIVPIYVLFNIIFSFFGVKLIA